MPIRLVSLDGHDDIPRDRAVVVAGRHRRCDVRVALPQVSRRHCNLAPARDEILLRDLGSTNGTRINDRRIEQGVLRSGDVLTTAHRRFQLEIRLPGELESNPRGRSHALRIPPQPDLGSGLHSTAPPRESSRDSLPPTASLRQCDDGP